MNIFSKLKATLMYREAVQRADETHAKRGLRCYVLPTEDGRLVVMDKYDLKMMKKRHYISKECKTIDLVRDAFYFTAHTDGNGVMHPDDVERGKKRMYIWWEHYLDMQRRIRKNR